MGINRRITRRRFLAASGAATMWGAAEDRAWSQVAPRERPPGREPLREVAYDDVQLHDGPARQQLTATHQLLMSLNEDSLLKPLRQMSGLPASGVDLGGWYHFDPNYDYHSLDAGFAPSATFGQWVSALSRACAITGDAAVRDKVLRLNQAYAQTISGRYYENNRFPAYCYDKLVGGLVDAHRWARDPSALALLEPTTDAALPYLPGRAIPQGQSWRPGTDESYTWDESYTISENLFKAYHAGAGDRYRTLASQYLADYLFQPLADGIDTLAARHAYSHVNALGSSMAAYMSRGGDRYLAAARYGFERVLAQSYATGGWGPDERLRPAHTDELLASLTNTHHSFETPCGTYAHCKLARALLRATRDSRYGDSMERILWNTVLGALPMQADGRTFYYADCNLQARKVYSEHRWPCCSGTMPQVATDYGINAFLKDDRGLYVNLYFPATVRWQQGLSTIALTLAGEYPFSEHVQGILSLPRSDRFALSFRIPQWAQGARLSVNGRSVLEAPPGQFATITRTWHDQDHIDLELPMRARLEALDADHSSWVALLHGPLVLLGTAPTPDRVSSQELLSVQRVGARRWRMATRSGPVTLLPFTEIGEETYTTYFSLG